MPILDMQRRLREAGRIRIGAQVVAKNGKSRPSKLEKFRLTSADQRAIDAAAALYGGTPQRWDGAPVGEQWELFTDANLLPVVIPPADTAFSQFYELWSGGGCQRRCDGYRELIGDQQCVCDPANRECKPHTRLNVMLRDLPGVGVWRLETQGYYAATELAGVSELLIAAATRGQLLPATLRLEQRQVKRPGEATKNFVVPVLDLDLHLGQIGLLAGVATPAIDAPNNVAALPAPRRFEPVPVAELAAPPERSVADQVAGAGKDRKPRTNSAAPMRPTGLKPKGMNAAAAPADDDPFRDDETVIDKPKLSDAQRLAMAAGDAGLTDDTERHAFYEAITGKTSGKDMLPRDIDQVLAHLERIKAGKVTVADYVNGTAIARDSEIGQAFAEAIKALPAAAQAALTDRWKQEGLRWPLAGADVLLWQTAVAAYETEAVAS